MSEELTPLEALDRLYDYHNLHNRNIVAYLLEQENLPTYRKIVEKSLKALEIIKENCRITLENGTFNIYCLTNLPEEEFDLLKEVLGK